MKPIAAIQKAVIILSRISEHGDVGLTELAGLSGFPKATTFRLVNTMKETGLVVQGVDAKYRLGPLLVSLGQIALERLELRSIARPVLESLNRKTGETVHLGALDLGDVVYIDKVEMQESIRMYSRIGKRVPAYCGALGKVLLAGLPSTEVEALLSKVKFEPRARNTITSPSAFLAHLDKVRELGFAMDDEETEDGICCVGAPIIDHNHEIVAAVSVSGLAVRIKNEKLAELIMHVTSAGVEISKRLGHLPQQDVVCTTTFRDISSVFGR